MLKAGIRARRTGLVLAVAAAFVGLGGWSAKSEDQALIIVDAMIFDATGTAPYRGDVLVREGRIAEVGRNVRAPAGATVVEARGKALLPGFFDLHTHWTPNGAPAATPVIAEAYVAAGVTTVNDFHQPPESFEPRRRWLAGMVSPHVNLTARISTPGGHGADWADQNTTRWVDTPATAREGVAEVAAYSPDLIKAFADGWRYGLSADNTSMVEPVLQALVEEAHARGLRVVTHTVTVDRGAEAARAGVDIIVHSLQDREVDADTIHLMKANNVAYAPTLAVYEPFKPGSNSPQNMDTPRIRQQLRKFDLALTNVRLLHQAGVLIALGTDAGMPGTPHGVATLHEMELLVRAGLTPTEAIMAGTSNSARAMGVLVDRGTIEVGKRADLVLIDGQPWRDIEAVRRTHSVFVDGRHVYGPGKGRVKVDAGALPPAITVGTLIDDFEREDERTALDTKRLEHFDAGAERTSQVSQILQDGQGNHYLNVTARMAHKREPYAGVVFPFSRGAVEPVDLTGRRGVRFDLRGDGRLYEVRLRGRHGAWRIEVTADDKWQTFELPFSILDAVARSDRRGASWDGDSLFDLTIRASRESGEALWFEMDNVQFF